jgi:hypothetical protein
MTVICPWCGAVITRRHRECPACGVFLVRLSMPAMAPARPHARSPRVFWFLAVVPIVFCVLLPAGALALHNWNQEPAAPSVRQYADPALNHVRTAGNVALRAKLGVSRLEGLSEGSMHISAGHLITLCGRTKVMAAGDDIITTRYLSMEGRGGGTKLEFQDPAFDVLWTRLCQGSYGGGW